MNNNDSPSKIAIFVNSDMISGAEIVLRDYLSKSKLKFALYVSSTKELVGFYQDYVSSVDVVPGKISKHKNKLISRIINTFVLFKQAYHIKKISEKNQYDLFYANSISAGIVLGIAKKIFRMKTPILTHVHDMIRQSSYRFLFKYFCSNSPIIAVSLKCKEEIINYCNIKEDNVSVAYNGIETPSSISYTTHNPYVIGFAGGIIPRKGLFFLVHALSNLKSKKDFILKIAYNVQDDNYWNMIKPFLKDISYKKEKYSRENMHLFYKEIDILVVPSLSDPFPTAVLEAMSFGKVVLGSNIDGIPEMIGENYLFESKNYKAICEILLKITSFDKDDIKKIQYQNYNFVCNNFSISSCSDRKDFLIKAHLN